jgi:hypothetical protein
VNAGPSRARESGCRRRPPPAKNWVPRTASRRRPLPHRNCEPANFRGDSCCLPCSSRPHSPAGGGAAGQHSFPCTQPRRIAAASRVDVAPWGATRGPRCAASPALDYSTVRTTRYTVRLNCHATAIVCPVSCSAAHAVLCVRARQEMLLAVTPGLSDKGNKCAPSTHCPSGRLQLLWSTAANMNFRPGPAATADVQPVELDRRR